MHIFRRRLFTATQFALDVLSFIPIWKCAAELRIILNPVMKLQLTSQDAPGWLPPLSLVLLLWVIVSWRLKLYRAPIEVGASSILAWAGRNSLAIICLTVVSTFFSRQAGAGASRMFVLCVIPASFLVLAATRAVATMAVAATQGRGRQPRIALIGDSTRSKHFFSLIEAQIGSAIRGVIVPETAVAAAAVGQLMPILGTTSQLAEVVNRERIDRVIVLNGSLSTSELERCNRVFWRMGLPVSCSVDLPVENSSPSLGWQTDERLRMFNQYGLPVVEMRPAVFARTYEHVKRAFDFGVTAIALFLLMPALLAIALVVAFTSDGPALDKAQRVGKGGRYFTCLKFRTTYIEDDATPGTAQRSVHPDDFLTPVGRFLRRYSLDELPQLLNILWGEMSLVGPRPLPAHNLGPDGMSREFFTWSETRARVHPGLTGLWQVSGRSSLSFDDMIRLDLEYIQNRSFFLDLSILLETPIPVLRGIGA